MLTIKIHITHAGETGTATFQVHHQFDCASPEFSGHSSIKAIVDSIIAEGSMGSHVINPHTLRDILTVRGFEISTTYTGKFDQIPDL